MIYGYLRETKELAIKAGINKVNNIPRTGLDEYLSIIFPNIKDWVHDKAVCKGCRNRPDYRSEELKLIVEFDGLPHYQKPDVIIKDELNTEKYTKMGYKVVRIPYFIQLTNKAVKQLFGVDVVIPLFKEGIPSLTVEDMCTPAYLCPLGIKRMAKELRLFPEQLESNIRYLKEYNNDKLTGLSYLLKELNNLQGENI